ncbi:hypothetical protein D3870_16425 [Noviherbaspirillum cavernae]|uniref:Uncharacterized protein n=1 Tax=Noviherbaspirillum cavernae TaxID=2320862 RepID=A0A418X4G1_9BURK|nr:hypothetical protein [Noviherbaspirillum cavernae]RJG07368.1 hypothetical protein D3870_16425 [Noviherbaspirillum cavernae]
MDQVVSAEKIVEAVFVKHMPVRSQLLSGEADVGALSGASRGLERNETEMNRNAIGTMGAQYTAVLYATAAAPKG